MVYHAFVVEMTQNSETRSERRERKRRKRRRMGVSGASVRKLQDIILRRSRDARRPRSAGGARRKPE